MSEGSRKLQALESEFRGLQILWEIELRSEPPDGGFLRELEARLEKVEAELARRGREERP